MQVERGAMPPSDVVPVGEIKQALAAWEKAAQQARECDREQVKLTRGPERAKADALDARDLADALQDGKPGPKTATHAEAFARQLDDAKRQASASAIIEERRWDDVQAALAQHIGELRQHTDQEFERRRADYVTAIDLVEQAHTRMTALIAMRTFLAQDGPGAGAYYRAGWAATITCPRPNALDDSQIAVPDVIAALRDVGGPPRAREGLNPQAYQGPEGGPRHLAPWQQGRVRQVAPPTGPAVRVPG